MSLITEDGVTAQRMVDSYAIQHATNPEGRNRQSVAVHLMSHCANLEYDIPGTELRVLMGGWTHRDYVLPEPVPTAYPVTVRDVSDATDEARSDPDLHVCVSHRGGGHSPTVRRNCGSVGAA